MKRRHRTWVLVADGAIAKIFENDEEGGDLTEVMTHEGPKDLTRDIVSDRQGRRGQQGVQHHAMDSRTDPQRHGEHEFARVICRHLDHQVDEDSFDRLILAAAPRTLGDIREMLSKRVRGRIVAELDKDFAHLSAHELTHQISKHVDL